MVKVSTILLNNSSPAQTMLASSALKPSWHTVPHTPLTHISTRPSWEVNPFTSLTSPLLHNGSTMMLRPLEIWKKNSIHNVCQCEKYLLWHTAEAISHWLSFTNVYGHVLNDDSVPLQVTLVKRDVIGRSLPNNPLCKPMAPKKAYCNSSPHIVKKKFSYHIWKNLILHKLQKHPHQTIQSHTQYESYHLHKFLLFLDWLHLL